MKRKLFLISLCLLFSLSHAFGQEERVSIKADNSKVQTILQDLQKNTPYRFTYNVEELDKAGRKSIDVENVSLNDALKLLFKDTRLDFKIEGNNVVITNTQQPKVLVRGTILSTSDKLGIPGVTVLWKEQGTGTTTDINGGYEISVPMGATLRFSFTGMETVEWVVNSTTHDFDMKEVIASLEEVVITGYGISRKAAFTGAASRVGEDVVKRQTGANVINSLQGSIPGVQISITSGSPGSSSPMQIRGLGSINAGTSPLYVIDGVPVFSGAYSALSVSGQDVDPLASLNPEDIESISVLKDASATSIYGSRASNGVVVITTKSGQVGKSTLQFNMRIGATTPSRLRHNFTMVNSEEYLEMLKESLVNSGVNPTNTYLEGLLNIKMSDYAHTDWWDEITRTGLIQDYSFSYSGGTEKNKHYVSLGFFEDEGFIIGSGTHRFSGRINLENKFNKVFTLSNSLSASYNKASSVSADLTKSNPIALARILTPVESPKNADGSWNLKTSATSSEGYGYNPLALYTDEYGDVKEQDIYKLTYSPTLRVNLGKNLIFQSRGGLDYLLMRGTSILSMLVNPVSIGTHQGLNSETIIERSTLINTNTINWMPVIDKHRFNVLAGLEVQNTTAKNTQTLGTKFPNYKSVYAISNAAETSSSTSKSSAGLVSYFANVEYDFADKYYLSGSIRRDGSSRFAEGHRWGTFYSIGAKYRISQEDFMANLTQIINNLTFRISYGTTGNQDVGYYQSLHLISYGANYDGGVGSIPNQLPNPDLTWETRKKFNVGFDLSLWDRVNFEFDYFNDKTIDLLFSVPISQTSGFSSIMRNIGSIQNTGFEGMVNVALIQNKDWRWTFNLNFTTYKNKVLKLAETIQGEFYIREEGRPWNQFWVRRFGGIDPQTGEVTFLLADGTKTTDATLAGLPENRHYYGTSDPKVYGGFGSRLEAFNFDLSAQFVYRIGGYAVSDENQFGEHTGWNKTSNWTYYVYENRWKEPGDEAALPKLEYGKAFDYLQRTEKGLQPLSYLKLRNVTLGYTFPSKIAKKLHLSRMRVYFSGDNLFSWYHKDYRGFDTDVNSVVTASNGFVYPTATNYIFGLNITF